MQRRFNAKGAAWAASLFLLCCPALSWAGGCDEYDPSRPALADDLACLSTTFRILGANDKVCISAFDDPKVAGVTCHISQARTGGVKGSLGLAEDPSRFAIACRQTGPITADTAKLPEE